MNKTNKQQDTQIRKLKLQARSLFNRGDFQQSGQLYTDICTHAPDAESHCMLGIIYNMASNCAQAEQHLATALQLKPDYEQAWSYLGITQASQGNYEAAVNSLNQALTINPKNTQALNNLGNIYRELGQNNSAEVCYKRVLKLEPKNAITVNNIANIYLTQCLYDKAEYFYKKAIKLNKDYFDAYYNLGATYQSKGEHKQATKYYKLAQKIRPEDIQPQIALANSYEKQGKFDKSLEIITPLLSRNLITPDLADIYSKICIKNKDYDAGINVIEKCLATRINPIHEQALRFSLGDLYNKQSAYDKAFKEYLAANTMRPYHYDRLNTENTFNHIIDVFQQTEQIANTENNSTDNKPTQTPIFIIGMPRSGTTLIEQIVSSHPLVFGAGELAYIGELAENSFPDTKAQYPDCIKQLTADKVSQLSNIYLKKIAKHNKTCPYITDKMPHNFLYVGFIKLLFPQSKIIHCLRNPLDVCLSIYFHNFNKNHPYTDNLSNLGHYYNQYRKLMAFWHNQYNDFIIDISYENVLTNTEDNIRNMLNHIGLDWNEDCLKFYENKRTISTPSYAQVNQPIYTASMERWRHYAPYINNLRNTVEENYLYPENKEN